MHLHIPRFLMILKNWQTSPKNKRFSQKEVSDFMLKVPPVLSDEHFGTIKLPTFEKLSREVKLEFI
jgi:hypothetical protein